MGGLQFFCTTMDEPNGDVDLLYESLKAMNFKSDPNEEERKGGSARIGKMLVSKDQGDSKLALVAYVPPSKQEEFSASFWMQTILEKLGGGEVVYKDAATAKAVIENDGDKGLFVLKLKDSAITESINLLKEHGLFPDSKDDSDDEFIFGDDDFPSAENEDVDAAEEEEAADNAEEEEAADIDDPFAMMGGMGEEEVYKVTLMQEAAEEEIEEANDVVIEADEKASADRRSAAKREADKVEDDAAAKAAEAAERAKREEEEKAAAKAEE